MPTGPRILIKITKSKWYKHEGVSWLSQGELQADALRDLRTMNNALSVWYIEENGSNLKQVITALAATCDSIQNFDYALFDLGNLVEANIKVAEVHGVTPYSEANSWHRDLIELTVGKMSKLVGVIANKGETETKRISVKDVAGLLVEALQSKKIDLASLKANMQIKLKKLDSFE